MFWIKPATAKAFHKLIAGMFLDALKVSCFSISKFNAFYIVLNYMSNANMEKY